MEKLKFLSMILVILSADLWIPAGAVVMPHRTVHEFQQRSNDSSPQGDKRYLSDEPDEPAVPSTTITITETSSGSLDVLTNSEFNLTVNLNKAVDHTIRVKLYIKSGQDLVDILSKDSKLQRSKASKSEYWIYYEKNMFGDRIVQFKTHEAAGLVQVICLIPDSVDNQTIQSSNAFISINIGKSESLRWIISIVGWIYFASWSLSFYFQVILNYQRKSVVGLNFDFLALNVLGFTCYSIYNLAMLFSNQIRDQYYSRNAYTRVPVEYNDLFFAIHATVITLATIFQCFIYDRGQQTVTWLTRVFSAVCILIGLFLWISSLLSTIEALDAILFLSYVKLVITIIKYTPQAYMNYKRKATSGWSIGNIILDLTGGTLSLTQMFLSAYNYDSWISIFGNITKFGMGLFSIAFDLLFIVQHYYLYRGANDQLNDALTEIPGPVISQSLRQSGYQSSSDDDEDSARVALS